MIGSLTAAASNKTRAKPSLKVGNIKAF